LQNDDVDSSAAKKATAGSSTPVGRSE
jgi:hypothetical protein